MKKTIFLFITIVAVFIGAFRPAPTPMQFETLEVKILSLPTTNADSTFTFPVQAWYGVVGNPYTQKMGPDWSWAKWVDLSIVVKTTDDKVVLSTALDTANAYRLRVYPDIK